MANRRGPIRDYCPPPLIPPQLEQRPCRELQRAPVEKVALFKSKGIPDAFIVLMAERGVRAAKWNKLII